MDLFLLLNPDDKDITYSASPSEYAMNLPSPESLHALADVADSIQPRMRRLKPKRKRASPHQLAVLNHHFAHNQFPTAEERRVIADAIDMAPRTVQIWFQNKRQIVKHRGGDI